LLTPVWSVLPTTGACRGGGDAGEFIAPQSAGRCSAPAGRIRLSALGVSIALDDFGTGYSSLQYLQRFPFDKIKIDRSFVKEVTRNSSSASIIRAVVSIAADRDMVTTAEGVETLQQRETVQNLGCTQMQGFLFSAARPAQEIRALLASGKAGVEAAA
jgi:EAL domain-containing protein (putative c-di-GMP-specific phosphodiesterase class I)